MSDFRPQDFDYFLVPGKAPVDFTDTAFYDDLFVFWKDFWTEVLQEVTGERRRMVVDDFMRQDYFAVLKYQNEIVGIHSYSFFNLQTRAPFEHSFFEKYFNESFICELRKRRVRTVMTMEFFSVAKSWRGVKTGISLAKALVALGLRLANEKGVDGTITAARADVPAANIASKLGAISLVETVEMHGKPTELMLFPANNVQEPTDIQSKIWLNDFWDRRIDLVSNVQSHNLKRTA